jgi:murein endopeptidase
MTIYARSTLHRGQRSSGSLVGGWNLPNQGTGYYHDPVNDAPDTDDFGGRESTIRLIEIVGAQWTPNPRFGVLDISRQFGGSFQPDHTEHQNGLDIDVRYVRNDGQEGRVNVANQQNLYSRDLTIQLMNLFATNGTLYRILVSPQANITSADVPGANIVAMDGHDDHFHVSLVDPDGADNNTCP